MPSQPEAIDAIRNPENVPPLVKRGIMGVMKNLKAGSRREKFENAFNIVVWRLTEGLKPEGKTRTKNTKAPKKLWRLDPHKLEQGLLEPTKLGKDIQNDKDTAKAGKAKIDAFDRLVKDLQKEVKREDQA